MVITADFSSILLQIFIIWLLSSIFSGKGKKKEKKDSGFIQKKAGKLFKNVTNIIEEKLSEYKIIIEDQEDVFITEDKEIIPPELQKKESKESEITSQKLEFQEKLKPLSNISDLKSKLGLNSKSTIRNAIIINEILGKPVSLKR